MLLARSDRTRPAPAALPWMLGDNPWQLVSLWDMLQFAAGGLIASVQTITALQMFIENKAEANPGMNVDPARKARYLVHLETLLRECEPFDMISVEQQVARIRDYLEGDNPKLATFSEWLTALMHRVKDDCDARLFLFIPMKDVDLYEADELFGPEVANSFPEQAFDIAEAGNCLALNRPTAAVFHLMRVMEAAVRRLARKLRIAVPPRHMWGNILGDITKKLAAMPEKTAKQRTKKIVWRELQAHLQAAKDAWRNPTSHTETKHRDGKARDIFIHVRSFMQAFVKLQ